MASLVSLRRVEQNVALDYTAHAPSQDRLLFCPFQGAVAATLFAAHLCRRRPELPPPRFAILFSGFRHPWPRPGSAALAGLALGDGPLPFPALVVSGANDETIPPAQAAALGELYAEHELYVHDADHGHAVPQRAKDLQRFAEFLERF